MDWKRAGLRACLGLPVAMLAHALLFGAGHSAGGDLHEPLLEAAVAVSAALLCAVAALLLSAQGAAQGSIVAGRLRAAMPAPLQLYCCAAAWFAAIEAHEPAHRIPIVAALVSLAAMAWLVYRLLDRFIGLVHGVALLLVFKGSEAVEPLRQCWIDAAPSLTLRLSNHRRFSRPPPLSA